MSGAAAAAARALDLFGRGPVVVAVRRRQWRRAFRQTSTAGDARAAVGPEQIVNTDQIVQARVRPRTFNAAGDPWVGVMARYSDPNNYSTCRCGARTP